MKQPEKNTPDKQEVLFRDFIEEEGVAHNTIEPQVRVQENLNRAFSRKQRLQSVKKVWPLAAASILIAVIILYPKLNADYEIHETNAAEITNTLLDLDRVENQSSRIIPTIEE